MAFCSKCGASLNDGASFCPSCGTQAASAAAPSASLAAPQSTGLTSNLAGALAYLFGFITGIFFLAVAPYNKDPFVRFHAFQSIFLSIFYIVFSMVWGMIFGALFIVSLGFMFSLIALAFRVVESAFFLLWLFMMFKAYQNERFSLPVIGPLAAKQAG